MCKTKNKNKTLQKISKYQRKQFYQSKEWKHLRKVILERDNFMCQDCIVKKLKRPRRARQIHHIKFLAHAWNLRLDHKNLVSLCVICHAKRHPELSPRMIKQLKRMGRPRKPQRKVRRRKKA